MTLEEKAYEYAKMYSVDMEGYEAIRQSYLTGATEALQSQWVSVEQRLPKEKKVVLCYLPNRKDSYAENGEYFDITILLENEFINLDGVIIHPTHWMPIPPVKGGEA